MATQDWHPLGHVSFASSHEGRAPMERIDMYGHEQILWPDHCIQGTDGLLQRDPQQLEPGRRPPGHGLAGYTRERQVEQVFIAGPARDYCVKWSAEDCADEGFTTYVLWDLSRPVDPSGDVGVREDLLRRGVGILESSHLVA